MASQPCCPVFWNLDLSQLPAFYLSTFTFWRAVAGIAPYRAYLRRMFAEDVPDYKFSGLAWLFMGVANSDATLYDDEFQEYLKTYPKQVGWPCRLYIASPSRQLQKYTVAGKMKIVLS